MFDSRYCGAVTNWFGAVVIICDDTLFDAGVSQTVLMPRLPLRNDFGIQTVYIRFNGAYVGFVDGVLLNYPGVHQFGEV